jgi:hypothetical protein
MNTYFQMKLHIQMHEASIQILLVCVLQVVAVRFLYVGEASGSRSDKYEESSGLLHLLCGRYWLTFQKILLPPSSGWWRQ